MASFIIQRIKRNVLAAWIQSLITKWVTLSHQWLVWPPVFLFFLFLLLGSRECARNWIRERKREKKAVNDSLAGSNLYTKQRLGPEKPLRGRSRCVSTARSGWKPANSWHYAVLTHSNFLNLFIFFFVLTGHKFLSNCILYVGQSETKEN